MADEEARAIWEALTPEQREELLKAAQELAQEMAKAFRELTESIREAILTLIDSAFDAFDAVQKAIEDAEIDVQPRKHWKPVKNTVPRYMCVQRRITPRARSCC